MEYDRLQKETVRIKWNWDLITAQRIVTEDTNNN